MTTSAAYWASRRTRAPGERAAVERAEARDLAHVVVQLRHWIDNPHPLDAERLAATLSGSTALVADAARVLPTARRVLGVDVFAAAVRDKVPACCHWGYARQLARVGERPERPFSADLVPLLGRPCNLCNHRWMRELTARVDAGRTTQPSGSGRRARASAAGTDALVASAAGHAAPCNCGTCGTCVHLLCRRDNAARAARRVPTFRLDRAPRDPVRPR